jgi:hypothetical protein
VVDKRRLRGGGRRTAPDDPEAKVSRSEFDEMVRDLHVDPAPKPSRRTAVADPAVPLTKKAPKPAPPQDDSADALPEDVVMPDRRDKPKPRGPAARRKGKHGRPR